MRSRSSPTRILHSGHRSEWRVDAIICLFRSDGPDTDVTAAMANATAAVALDDVEAAAAEKAIGLRASGESVRAQALARSDLMGQRDRVLRRQMLRRSSPGSSLGPFFAVELHHG